MDRPGPNNLKPGDKVRIRKGVVSGAGGQIVTIHSLKLDGAQVRFTKSIGFYRYRDLEWID